MSQLLSHLSPLNPSFFKFYVALIIPLPALLLTLLALPLPRPMSRSVLRFTVRRFRVANRATAERSLSADT